MKRLKLFTSAFLSLCFLFCGMVPLKAQNGDQILDGIGETAMISRYLLNGDTKDWSRNNLHAQYAGADASFVNDNRFGKVLLLNSEAKSYLKVPAESLHDIESLTIAGWVNLRSNKANQPFFSIGKGEEQPAYTAFVNGVDENKWVHITVVLDVVNKTIQQFIDARPAGDPATLTPALIQLMGAAEATQQQIFVGKSAASGVNNLHAWMHDFRIYRVPLSRRQVVGIFSNARGSITAAGPVNTRREEVELPKFAADQQQLYNQYLVEVSDIAVATEVGTLPRFPSYVAGKYKDGLNGPKVRVIWPADTDNNAVLKPGSYTVTGRVAGTNFKPKAVVTVKPAAKAPLPKVKLQPFALSQVSLQADATGKETKFIQNRDKFIRTLAKTDPNSFLYMFRHAFGQPQPEGAKPLGTWDTRDTKLRGHATGHYLTAIAQAYASSGYDQSLQNDFSQKMTYMVDALYNLSQLSGKPATPGGPSVADPKLVPKGPGKTDYDSDLTDAGIRNDYWNWGKGFISAYPPDQFIMLEAGAKYGGQKNQVWAPYYTLHKILAGLLDIYDVSGNKKALEIATNMSDWVHARLSQLPKDTLIKIWNTYIAGEYGGMNETMARMYQLTGEKNYLKTAEMFDNVRVFFGDTQHSHGLAKNVDLFRGLHANQHIPQIVGSLEMYKASNDPAYYKVADNFWYKIVNDYMYSIGGVAGARNPANAECFLAQPGTLYENGFSGGGQNETCATYNMLKLTSSLFLFEQRGELMDYYERSLYNHILASVAESTPANTYHVPLRPGSIKQFGNPNMTGFTCCNGTSIESNTKLHNSIYFKHQNNQALYVNLFIPSTLNWTEKKMVIEQTTSYPKDDETKLTVKGNGKFDMHIRVPNWATKGYIVKVNGKPANVKAVPGSYVQISRVWKSGDIVEVKMPFQFHLDPVMDQQNIASLFYGPILLAAQETEARKEWRKITFDANDIGKSITGDPKQLQFNIGDVVFKPFYDSYGRHSVYLDVQFN